MDLQIRKYLASDIKSLYHICLLASNNGNDVELLKETPEIVGDIYLAPYTLLEPELCFVLITKDEPCGYIIGTKNSDEFYVKSEKDYFIPLREKYELPKKDDNSRVAHLKRVIHKGHKPKDCIELYPAHLHINILPIAKGKGMGRKLIDRFIDELKTQKVSGLHLEVGKSNTNAIEFYKHIGFKYLTEYEYSLLMGFEI